MYDATIAARPLTRQPLQNIQKTNTEVLYTKILPNLYKK